MIEKVQVGQIKADNHRRNFKIDCRSILKPWESEPPLLSLTINQIQNISLVSFEFNLRKEI